MKITSSRGTIIVDQIDGKKPEFLSYDERIKAYCAPAFRYYELKIIYNEAEDTVFEDKILDINHNETLRSY